MSNKPVIKNEQDRATVNAAIVHRWNQAMDRYEAGHLPSLVAAFELQELEKVLGLELHTVEFSFAMFDESPGQGVNRG